MKNILLVIPSFLALGSAVLSAFLAWQVTVLQHTNDELSDDKAALLIDRQKCDEERQRLLAGERSRQEACKAYENKLARLLEEKESLGRSLVATLDRCAQLQMELKKKDEQVAAAEVKRVEQEKAMQERIAREKAALEKAACEQRVREKAEADRLAALSQNPLRVEDLKPIDPKKVVKSDQESLDELLELTAQKGSKGTQTKDVK